MRRTGERSWQAAMFSWGEMFVVFGASAMLFGTKDLPIFSRKLGTLIGRGVASLRRMKDEYAKASQFSEFGELHQEMRKTLFEINSIQSEIRSNVQIIPPMYGSLPFSPIRQPGMGNTVTAYQSMQNNYQQQNIPQAQPNTSQAQPNISQAQPNISQTQPNISQAQPTTHSADSEIPHAASTMHQTRTDWTQPPAQETPVSTSHIL
eukprot:225753-Hanusia_phi.AAC.1